LYGKVTRLRWNFEKNTVDASDEWWEKEKLVCVSQVSCLVILLGLYLLYFYMLGYEYAGKSSICKV